MRLIDLVGTYTKGLAVGERERERLWVVCMILQIWRKILAFGIDFGWVCVYDNTARGRVWKLILYKGAA